MAVTRIRAVAEARKWIGTPFHHQGRAKGIGCDCLGLLVGIARDLQITVRNSTSFLSDFDSIEYSKIPDGEKLRAKLGRLLKEVPENKINPGDILLLRFGNNPQHLAITSDYGSELGMIHCYREVGKVVEHRLNDFWRDKIVNAYSFV